MPDRRVINPDKGAMGGASEPESQIAKVVPCKDRQARRAKKLADHQRRVAEAGADPENRIRHMHRGHRP